MSSSAVGFFGKLPCKGDFLQRRVPHEFLEIWDPWLQACLHGSREILQEAWLTHYLRGAMWRFVLSSGVCGSGAYAGVLAPSVDRVGRYFPLTLLAQMDTEICPLDFAASNLAWFESLEALVTLGLDEATTDLDRFDAQVAELTLPDASAGSGAATELFKLLEHSRFPAQGGSWRAPLGSAGTLQAAINAYAYRDLAAQLRPVSLWWSDGSDVTAPSWLSLRGLPQPENFAAMLDGRWLEHDWQDLGEVAAAEPAPQALRTQPAVDQRNDAPTHAVPLAVPRVTIPDVQLTDIESNRAAFVIRPEVGLWAIATVVDPAADTTALRLIALALQQVAPAGSLTGLVESVRSALTQVHEQLCYMSSRDVQRVDAQGQLVAMAAFGTECALLSAGPVQSLRVRANRLEALEPHGPGDSGGAGMLTDLLHPEQQAPPPLGAPGFRHLQVEYERLLREDQWILCARTLIEAEQLRRLASMAASGVPLSAILIRDQLAPLIIDSGAYPLMTVQI